MPFVRMTWNSNEVLSWQNIAANSPTFTLRGGGYGLTVHAGSWGTGNVVLQRLGLDGATWVSVITPLTADSYINVNLPSGTYRLAVNSVTGIYADLVSVIVVQ